MFVPRACHLILVLVTSEVLALPKAQKWVFVSYAVNFFALSILVFTLNGRERDSILTPCSNKIWKPHFNLILPGSHEGNGGESPVFPKFHSLGQSVKIHHNNGFSTTISFILREGIWQYLETFLFVTTEEVPLAFSV